MTVSQSPSQQKSPSTTQSAGPRPLAKPLDPWHLERAYAECRAIAKREAKNFYYAFRVLPREKSDAMCAIYSFMRRADDIADEESRTVSDRRKIMASWLAAFRESTILAPDPVFAAVRDTQRRFNISNALLEQLVSGTTMDLQESQPGVVTLRQAIGGHEAVQIYDRFDDLYRYCYLVASVVGLVTIRVFGYRDSAAELLAEQTGVAFQLTNILRDVKEDVERGRIYLPLEDLTQSQVAVEDVALTASGAKPAGTLKPLLRVEGERAMVYYGAAEKLLPMIDRDSRAALWVMVTIYRGLLERIIAKDYDVFTERVSVPTKEKLWILAQGALKAARYRLFA